MAWKCSKCGAHGDPNPKGVLGFVLLHGCINCFEIKLPKMCHKCGHGPCECRIGNKSLGKALREIRIAKGLSLREIPGVSSPYLCQVENGKVKDISFKKLLLLCKCYGVDIKYFEQFT